MSPSCIIIAIVFFLQLSSQSFGAFRFIMDFPVTCAKYVKSPCPMFSYNNMSFQSWKKLIKKRIKNTGTSINFNLKFVHLFLELRCAFLRALSCQFRTFLAYNMNEAVYKNEANGKSKLILVNNSISSTSATKLLLII